MTPLSCCFSAFLLHPFTLFAFIYSHINSRHLTVHPWLCISIEFSSIKHPLPTTYLYHQGLIQQASALSTHVQPTLPLDSPLHIPRPPDGCISRCV